MTVYTAPRPPAEERERQEAVERSGILWRGRDGDLQGIVDRAATKLGTPIAAITVMDRRRQWFAARVGLDDAWETPRSHSICAHGLHRPGEVLVVADATQDRRFAAHPAVIGSPWVRFYAGKPLVTRDGYPLGALCVVDTRPRATTPDLYELTFLAFQAERIINGWS